MIGGKWRARLHWFGFMDFNLIMANAIFFFFLGGVGVLKSTSAKLVDWEDMNGWDVCDLIRE